MRFCSRMSNLLMLVLVGLLPALSSSRPQGVVQSYRTHLAMAVLSENSPPWSSASMTGTGSVTRGQQTHSSTSRGISGSGGSRVLLPEEDGAVRRFQPQLHGDGAALMQPTFPRQDRTPDPMPSNRLLPETVPERSNPSADITEGLRHWPSKGTVLNNLQEDKVHGKSTGDESVSDQPTEAEALYKTAFTGDTHSPSVSVRLGRNDSDMMTSQRVNESLQIDRERRETTKTDGEITRTDNSFYTENRQKSTERNSREQRTDRQLDVAASLGDNKLGIGSLATDSDTESSLSQTVNTTKEMRNVVNEFQDTREFKRRTSTSSNRLEEARVRLNDDTLTFSTTDYSG